MIFSQDSLKNDQKISLNTVLENWMDRIDYNILYNPDLLKEIQVSPPTYGEEIIEFLKNTLVSEDFELSIKKNTIVIVKKKPKFFRVSGYIKERIGEQTLPYAHIISYEKAIYTSCNENGHFSMMVEEGLLNLTISYLGHSDTTVQIDVTQDQNVNISLNTQNELQEVIINQKNINNPSSNRYEYRAEKLNKLTQTTPNVGGNNDLLNTTKSIAGIKSGSGGIGGYYIRGGNNSQNLFLLDGVSIYNPFHSLGLTSIFTSENTKSLKVYKSGFRAHHEDRSAGVLDIQIKDGSMNKIGGQVEINTQDGAIIIEGPLVKNNTSLFFSARTTSVPGPFNNIVTEAIYADNNANNTTTYNDITVKLKNKINTNNQLLLTYYRGRDLIDGEFEDIDFGYNNEQVLNWGNELATINLLSQLSPQIFANTRASFNRFYSDFRSLYLWEFTDEEEEYVYYNETVSTNRDLKLEHKVDINISPHFRAITGLSWLNKDYNPINTYLTIDSEDIDAEDITGLESIESVESDNSFISNKFSLHGELNYEDQKNHIVLGIRNNFYQYDIYSTFDMLPRINISRIFSDHHSIHLSISKTVQYDKLLSTSDIFLPQDLWFPANEELIPESGWHFNLSQNIKLSPRISLTTDLYHKRIKNVTYSSLDSLENSVELLGLYHIEGSLFSTGLELGIELNNSRLFLNLAYGLSKTTLNYDQLNLGISFPSQFDRRHELKIISSYRIANQWHLGINMSLSTGHPYLITNTIDPELGLVPIDLEFIGEKNSSRTPVQHRTDLSLLYTIAGERLSHLIKFNLYNTYGVEQPLYYTLESDGIDEIIKPNFSLPMIPSLSYSIKF